MRQHVIAELLRVPKPGAMANHWPGMGPHHSDMVGDVARIRGAGADVDHSNAAAVWRDEMKGRHLRRALRRGARRTGAAMARIARDDVSRLDEGLVTGIAFRQALVADPREGIGVGLV